MTDIDLKDLAQEAVKAAASYLAGALGPIDLHERAAAMDAALRDLGHAVVPASLREAVHILSVSMRRTSACGGTHEVVWRNVMQSMAEAVRFELGERGHPDDPPRVEIPPAVQSNELQLLLTLARVVRSQYSKPHMTGQDCVALLGAAMAPFEPRVEAEHG